MGTRVFGFTNRRQRVQLPIGFAIMGLVAASGAVRGELPAGFLLAWTAIVAWNGLWFLCLMAHTVEVVGDRVVWRATLRRREVALADLTGNGSLLPGFSWLTLRGGGRLWVLSDADGWPQFLAALADLCPGESFRASRSEARLQRRGGGRPSGFYVELRRPRPDSRDR